ncbi:hypothetical protein [Pseudothermotoga sp.]|uniref:hypothetical protein n=1 Tax=Pseudothermotoga sp. TaxID=2033661 RepID=UPI0031F6C920
MNWKEALKEAYQKIKERKEEEERRMYHLWLAVYEALHFIPIDCEICRECSNKCGMMVQADRLKEKNGKVYCLDFTVTL